MTHRRGHGLASDHLEPAVSPGPLGAGVDVAAVEADDQRQVRPGQLGPLGRAPGDEARLLVAELVLQALRGGLHLAPHCRGVQDPAQRQDFAQHVGGQSVGHQPGEACLQIGQLRGGPLAEGDSERAERSGRPRLAGAAPQPRAAESERAEQRPDHDGPAVLVTVRDSAVRARSRRGQRGGDLMLDERVLHPGEQVFGLFQLQAKGFRREGAALHGERLTHHGLGVVVGVQHDLHGDLHAAPAPVADSAARAPFTVRRSNRSTPSSGRRAASSSRCSPNRVRSSAS